MLRRKQRMLCYIVACLLFVAGMYTTYAKADSFAKCAVVVSRAGSAAANSVERLVQRSDSTVQEMSYLAPRAQKGVSTMIGRVTSRNSSIRRDLRMPLLFLWGLVLAYFQLRYFGEAEILCLHEKKYWTALIKYIHDIDGKKRIVCLT